VVTVDVQPWRKAGVMGATSRVGRNKRLRIYRNTSSRGTILAVHRQIARRELRESRIYDENGRRRPSTIPK